MCNCCYGPVICRDLLSSIQATLRDPANVLNEATCCIRCKASTLVTKGKLESLLSEVEFFGDIFVDDSVQELFVEGLDGPCKV